MKVVVLSSGGLDSTTCVGMACRYYGKENVVTISVLYGQKHDKELQCAKKVAEYYGVPHFVFDLSEVFKWSDCSLLKGSTQEIKHESYAEQLKTETRVSTYVPFRNGLLLSTAAAIGISLFPDEKVEILYGAHADDYAGNAYPDCSPHFNAAMNSAISIGTGGDVRISAPFLYKDKAGVVKTGLELHVPYELTWSCYEGGDKQCGTCATCLDRKEAFRKNNATDPVAYKK